jgi:hypothetical protein
MSSNTAPSPSSSFRRPRRQQLTEDGDSSVMAELPAAIGSTGTGAGTMMATTMTMRRSNSAVSNGSTDDEEDYFDHHDLRETFHDEDLLERGALDADDDGEGIASWSGGGGTAATLATYETTLNDRHRGGGFNYGTNAGTWNNHPSGSGNNSLCSAGSAESSMSDPFMYHDARAAAAGAAAVSDDEEYDGDHDVEMDWYDDGDRAGRDADDYLEPRRPGSDMSIGLHDVDGHHQQPRPSSELSMGISDMTMMNDAGTALIDDADHLLLLDIYEEASASAAARDLLLRSGGGDGMDGHDGDDDYYFHDGSSSNALTNSSSNNSARTSSSGSSRTVRARGGGGAAAVGIGIGHSAAAATGDEYHKTIRFSERTHVIGEYDEEYEESLQYLDVYGQDQYQQNQNQASSTTSISLTSPSPAGDGRDNDDDDNDAMDDDASFVTARSGDDDPDDDETRRIRK